ncbi:MAG: hypothetical protein JXB29_07960 [Sedimentisphaerales bacterium]|nr:hypothetical protein [Sedimentisphaerales bacterium]
MRRTAPQPAAATKPATAVVMSVRIAVAWTDTIATAVATVRIAVALTELAGAVVMRSVQGARVLTMTLTATNPIVLNARIAAVYTNVTLMMKIAAMANVITQVPISVVLMMTLSINAVLSKNVVMETAVNLNAAMTGTANIVSAEVVNRVWIKPAAI